MQSTPPFENAVLLKGLIVKLHDIDGGTRMSLRHGNENYKVFIPKEIMSRKDLDTFDGIYVRFNAKKDRIHQWVAVQKVQYQPTASG